MGTYDTLGRVQLKSGMCVMQHFEIGDSVETVRIDDGVHIGYGGVVIVKDGIFIAEFEHIIDKYGGIIDVTEIINVRNPITRHIKEKDNG